MNFLITAGNTQSPIDQVRCVTNIFSGRTGASIARTAWGRGHTVTLATSHPESLHEFDIHPRTPPERMTVLPYRTFDELTTILQNQLKTTPFDAICHSAAVSDFLCAGTYATNPGTFFSARHGRWESQAGGPTLVEQKGGKISSKNPELWLRLVRAPKLIDRFRQPWGFGGILVKFKLEVGIGETELLQVAEASRKASDADLMVANTLDGASHWAYLGPQNEAYERLQRRDLPDRLILAIEALYQEQVSHG